jgi:hypothetical protein
MSPLQIVMICKTLPSRMLAVHPWLMAELSGQVRYRFRSDDPEVQVSLEGEAEWVAERVGELGLEGVGWTMPVGEAVKATNLSEVSKSNSKKSNRHQKVVIDDTPLEDKPLDMGPTPDPSRIPIVRRPIGELNLQKEIDKIGVDGARKPDPIELMEMLDDTDEPMPAQGKMSVDPMAEAWLRELMEIVVREYGGTALRTGVIEEVASSKLGNRQGVELDVWLESLFSAGKLVKIHGGDAVGWGPSPRWLNGRI